MPDSPIMGSLCLFMSFAIDKILLRDPNPGEPLPSLPGEGYSATFSTSRKRRKRRPTTKPEYRPQYPNTNAPSDRSGGALSV
jgi:hypothetical protein